MTRFFGAHSCKIKTMLFTLQAWKQESSVIKSEIFKRKTKLILSFQSSVLDPFFLNNDLIKAASFREKLWEDTCFELFIFEENSNQYREINISPTGDWTFFKFKGIRQLEYIDQDSCPLETMSYNRKQHLLEIILSPKISLNSTHLLKPHCILKSPDTKNLMYFATKHPFEDRPDFHNLDGVQAFNLTL